MSSQQHARLSLFGQPPLRCQVAAVDVARLSLELSAGDSNTHLLVGDVAELRIEHPPLRITGQLTAINGRLLTFTPNPDQRPQLQQLLDHSRDEGGRPADTDRRRLLETLYSYASQQYAGLLDYFFDEADVQLIRMAEWAANNQDQSQLFELKANLKTREATIKQLALRYLRARIEDSSPEARDDPRDTRKRELELVDLERFEDWLSVEKVVRKWESELYQPLHFLEQRVGSLLDQQLSRRHQPLGIGNFCRALEDALRQVNLASQSLPTVYSLFDRTVGPHFPELIDGLNNRLKQAGVLPDLEAQWHRQARQRPSLQSPATAPAPGVGVAGTGSDAGMPQPQPPASADRLFSTALSLHHQGTASDTESTQRPATGRVMAVLQSLQQRLAEGLADSGAPLLQRLESDGKALADSERHIIGLIDQVFTTLADNGHLTSAAKSTLQRLQAPLAQAALANPERFNSPDHPARAMLNQLAVLYDSTELPNQLLEKRISAVVDTVLQDYSGDDHCFAQAHTELQQLLEQQQRAYRRNVERVTKTYAGRQQLKKAQRAVARELERRLPPTAIPQLVVDLIDNGWRELMTLTYIKNDEQHAGWREQLTAIEQLYHWLCDPQSLQDPTEALALVDRISHQLDSVFPGSYRHQPVLQRLRETLQGGADLASGIATTTPGWEPSGASNPGEVYSQLEANHPDMGRWLSRARNVEVGAEFGHLDRDQPEDRLRLAWKIDDLQHFVFVNRRGQKVLDYDLLDLAQDMARGFSEVSTDSNWPLMERSLFATVQ
ncbi:MAG: DUF1631 family protein, partial [Spongiibacteraceae bacterium]|nr:DUF1631 family protein [Spongiibacteraceae bacterium]